MKSDIIPYVGTKVNLPTSYEIPAYSIVTGGSLPLSSLAVILGPKKKKKNLEVIFFYGIHPNKNTYRDRSIIEVLKKKNLNKLNLIKL